jgi:hypothetical protein
MEFSLLLPEARDGAALLDHIYLDAMGFGMGCCCLQLTFQACNVDEARRMYDALIPVGPILVRFCPLLNVLLDAECDCYHSWHCQRLVHYGEAILPMWTVAGM